MGEIKVSVIIPIYNTKEYIARCLDSCIEQTLSEIEIIVINDGSTDGSLQIIQQYAAHYDNVKFQSIENSGLSIARNTGLLMAKGKYVYFCDSDDWMELDCLEKLYTFAEENCLEMVTFDAKPAGDITLLDSEGLSRYTRIDTTRIYSGKDFIYEESVQAWLYFTRRDFLIKNNVSFLPKVIYEDWKFSFDCMYRAQRIMYLPRELYNRFYRENSIMTSKLSKRKLLSPYESAIGMLETIEKSERCSKNKIIWMKSAAFRLNRMIRISYEAEMGELRKMLTECYWEIEQLEYVFFEKYWKMLKALFSKPDNLLLMLSCMESVLSVKGVLSKKANNFISDIYQYREDYIKEAIQKLPFSDKGKKIGIYGSGKHTEGLLRNYRNMIGDIQCDIVYIDSYIPSYTKRLDFIDIVNVQDAPSCNLDGIVISSLYYETNMLERVKESFGKNIVPVYILYNGETYALDLEPDKEDEIKKRLLNYKKDIEEKRIFLIGTPEHTNTGDYLITYAEREFFRTYLPDYHVIEVTGREFRENQNNIIGQISRLDIVAVTGGGFFGSFWEDGETLQMALGQFPRNKTIVFPQSLYFEQNRYGEYRQSELCKAVRKHKNLTICYREAISLERGKAMLGEDVPQYLFPDMALFLHGMEYGGKRDGILICLRKDVEGVLTDQQKAQITSLAKETGEKVSSISMHWSKEIKKEERDEVLQKKLDEIGGAKLVIADALHCVLSCALKGTPCIALPSATGKTEGVFRWIEKLPYIKYVDVQRDATGSMEEIRKEITNLLVCYAGNHGTYDMDFNIDKKRLAALVSLEGNDK